MLYASCTIINLNQLLVKISIFEAIPSCFSLVEMTVDYAQFRNGF